MDSFSGAQYILINREKEIKFINNSFDIVKNNGVMKVIFITGDFGSGKTYLIERFFDQSIVKVDPVLIGRSVCSSGSELNGYLPIIHLLKDLINQASSLSKTPIDVRSILYDIAPMMLNLMPRDLGELPRKTPEYGINTFKLGEFSQEYFFIQISNFLKMISKEYPIILFVDDICNADISSLSLLSYLIMDVNLKNCPILLLCTYRQIASIKKNENTTLLGEMRTELLRHNKVIEICLENLDVYAYLNNLFPNHNFTDEFIDKVKEVTDGNALFLDLLFKKYSSPNTVSSNESINSLEELLCTTPFPLPSTIHDILAERKRSIEDELCDLLDKAAIEGQIGGNRFTAQVLVSLLNPNNEEVAYKGLEKLDRIYQVIKLAGSKQMDEIIIDIYCFIHSYFRNFLYFDIAPVRRRFLHKHIGDCLESLYKDPLEIAHILAKHYSEGNVPEKAAKYALAASQIEYSHGAWKESSSWAIFGIHLLNNRAEYEVLKLDLLQQLAVCYYEMSEFKQGLPIVQKAIDKALFVGSDNETLGNLYFLLGNIYDYMGDINNAKSTFISGINLYGKKTISKVKISLEAGYAYIMDRQGETSSAIDSYNRLLSDMCQLPENDDLLEARSVIFVYLGVALSNTGRFFDANKAYENLVALAKIRKQKRIEAMGILNLADVALTIGDHQKFLVYISEGLEIAEKTGDLGSVQYAKGMLGTYYLEKNDLPKAEDMLLEAISISEKIQCWWNMSSLYSDLARLYLNQGKNDEALKYSETAIVYGKKADYQLELSRALCTYADVLFARGDYKMTDANYLSAIDIQKRCGYLFFQACSQRDYANILIKSNEKVKGLDLLNNSQSIFERLSLNSESEKTRFIINNL